MLERIIDSGYVSESEGLEPRLSQFFVPASEPVKGEDEKLLQESQPSKENAAKSAGTNSQVGY
jgi:hypothetical protein